jgi:hypothetical protein
LQNNSYAAIASIPPPAPAKACPRPLGRGPRNLPADPGRRIQSRSRQTWSPLGELAYLKNNTPSVIPSVRPTKRKSRLAGDVGLLPHSLREPAYSLSRRCILSEVHAVNPMQWGEGSHCGTRAAEPAPGSFREPVAPPPPRLVAFSQWLVHIAITVYFYTLCQEYDFTLLTR